MSVHVFLRRASVLLAVLVLLLGQREFCYEFKLISLTNQIPRAGFPIHLLGEA